MLKAFVMALVVTGLMAAGGCRKASERIAEKMAEKAIEKNGGGKANVDISDGKISVKTKEGEMVATSGGSASIPSDFPKDVLVLKDAKLLATVKVPDGFSVTMESKDAPENIVKKYAAEMKANGWTEQASVDMGSGTMISYNKEKENRTTTVMVSKGDKITQVVVTAANPTGKRSDAGEKPAAE
jgi:hypothetical protein